MNNHIGRSNLASALDSTVKIVKEAETELLSKSYPRWSIQEPLGRMSEETPSNHERTGAEKYQSTTLDLGLIHTSSGPAPHQMTSVKSQYAGYIIDSRPATAYRMC